MNKSFKKLPRFTPKTQPIDLPKNQTEGPFFGIGKDFVYWPEDANNNHYEKFERML